MQKESLNLNLKHKSYKQSKIETISVFKTETKINKKTNGQVLRVGLLLGLSKGRSQLNDARS